MRIGEIAAEAGVSTKTIRFWEARGLLPEPERTHSGYRDYGRATIERVDFIRHAQGAGLRLEEIRQVLHIADSGERPCGHVGLLIERHLTEVNRRLAELRDTQRYLTALASRAAAQDPAECRDYCSILVPDDSGT